MQEEFVLQTIGDCNAYQGALAPCSSAETIGTVLRGKVRYSARKCQAEDAGCPYSPSTTNSRMRSWNSPQQVRDTSHRHRCSFAS